MKYYSTTNRSPKASFREAVLNGLAPDGGLYIPESFPLLSHELLTKKNSSIHEVGMAVAEKCIGDEISKNTLQDIISESLNFVIPVFPISDSIFIMELFHGPTLAFKDVGARFMARTLSHLIRNEKQEITILTATSGDTGSAVANGFYGVEGIRVIILYPSGGVSALQEKQMTTLGRNITALEVKGTFDDCQRLVKGSFSDEELRKKLNLTSANSINIARLIPQSFYYLYARSFFEEKEQVVFSVPSGNFGNMAAGLMAKKMGMNARFIAATNINDVVPAFLKTGLYNSKPSQKTISNAMDVGSPSNFSRILAFYNDSYEEIRKDVSGVSVSDSETRSTMKNIFREKKYMLDPHGAVGYAAASSPSLLHGESERTARIILATAHPAKFKEVVEDVHGIAIELPDLLKECLKKEKSAVKITADLTSLKNILL